METDQYLERRFRRPDRRRVADGTSRAACGASTRRAAQTGGEEAEGVALDQVTSASAPTGAEARQAIAPYLDELKDIASRSPEIERDVRDMLIVSVRIILSIKR